MVALSEAAFHQLPTPKTVGEVMTQPPEWITSRTEIFAVVSMLAGGRRKRVPVVDDGVLVGIITRRDLMRALVTYTADKETPDHHDTTDEVAVRKGMHNPVSSQGFSAI